MGVAEEGICGVSRGDTWVPKRQEQALDQQAEWKLIEERKEIKTKLDSTKSERIWNRIREVYRQKDKEVKSSVRGDKKRWMTENTQVAQKAVENRRAKELYDITRQLSSNGPRKMVAITNKDGKLLKSKEERQARWKEHFEEVLNKEAPPNQ